MNCPHGWLQIDPDTECGACARELEQAQHRLSVSIARRLAHCLHRDIDEQHELAWCKDCGAVRHRLADGWTDPLYVSEAKALDLPPNPPGVIDAPYNDDSGE